MIQTCPASDPSHAQNTFLQQVGVHDQVSIVQCQTRVLIRSTPLGRALQDLATQRMKLAPLESWPVGAFSERQNLAASHGPCDYIFMAPGLTSFHVRMWLIRALIT